MKFTIEQIASAPPEAVAVVEAMRGGSRVAKAYAENLLPLEVIEAIAVTKSAPEDNVQTVAARDFGGYAPIRILAGIVTAIDGQKELRVRSENTSTNKDVSNLPVLPEWVVERGFRESPKLRFVLVAVEYLLNYCSE